MQLVSERIDDELELKSLWEQVVVLCRVLECAAAVADSRMTKVLTTRFVPNT